MLVPEWVACAHPRPQWVSPMTSPVRLGVSPAVTTPTVFSLRGLRLYFPALEPWVARSASLPAVCLVYLCVNVGLRGATHTLPAPLSATLSPDLSVYLCVNERESSLPLLPISAPPISLDECLFFYLLGVRLPCHSIFCQFWLCEEAQCVYLRCHLGSPIYSHLRRVLSQDIQIPLHSQGQGFRSKN